MNKIIAILTHETDNFRSGSYLLRRLADVWEAAGYKITILKGTDHYEPADILIIHADLTRLPEHYVAFAGQYPVVVNGRVLNISKRRISRNIVDKDDNNKGPVIVKTDSNFGGLPERHRDDGQPVQILLSRLQMYFPISWQRFLSRVQIHLFPGWIHSLTPYSYPVYANLANIPGSVWLNPDLVVERYRPEREGNYYCLRQWLFMGDREINKRGFSHDPIVKARNVVHREEGIPVPADLRNLRQELGFDYGKFDYGVVDGETILYDANWTPTINFRKDMPSKVRLVEELSQGLKSFLWPNE